MRRRPRASRQRVRNGRSGLVSALLVTSPIHTRRAFKREDGREMDGGRQGKHVLARRRARTLPGASSRCRHGRGVLGEGEGRAVRHHDSVPKSAPPNEWAVPPARSISDSSNFPPPTRPMQRYRPLPPPPPSTTASVRGFDSSRCSSMCRRIVFTAPRHRHVRVELALTGAACAASWLLFSTRQQRVAGRQRR